MNKFGNYCVLLILLMNAFSSAAQAVKHIIPLNLVLDKFETYDLVSIGEIHGSNDLHQLYIELIKNKEFQEKVNVIVLEFGNALYQETLDKYIANEDVPYKNVQKVWRNMLVSQMVSYHADEFAAFVKTVREENKKIPKHKKMRVVVGGVPFDWEKPGFEKGWNLFHKNNPRDPHYAKVVINEVLNKNKKALLISGSLHLKKMSYIPAIINQKYPGKLYAFLTANGFGDLDDNIKSKLIPKRPLAYDLSDSSWLSKVDAYLIAQSTGNITYRTVEENEAVKERDVFISLDDDNQRKVEHVINGKKVLVYSKSKALTKDPLSISAMGGIIGASKGMSIGRYRRSVIDEGRSLYDVADGLILIDGSKKVETPSYIWEDDQFWNELNRRNTTLYDIPIDPMIRKTKGAADHH